MFADLLCVAGCTHLAQWQLCRIDHIFRAAVFFEGETKLGLAGWNKLPCT